MALAHPEVRFTFSVDGREAITTPGSERLQDVILSIYGSEVAGRMLPVSLADGDVAVDGYTGAPELNRRNRSYTTLLVNRRWVYDRSIYYAIEQAYQGTLPDRRFPFAMLSTYPCACRTGGRQFPSHQAGGAVPQRRPVVFPGAARRAGGPDRPCPGADGNAIIQLPSMRLRGQPSSPVTPRLSSTGGAVRGEPTASRCLPPTLAPAEGSLRDVLADLRVVGQIRQTYIVAEGGSGMYLIDQHAAHERVVFDQIRQRSAGRSTSDLRNHLLAPMTAELSAAQAVTLESYADLLADYGFRAGTLRGSRLAGPCATCKLGSPRQP